MTHRRSTVLSTVLGVFLVAACGPAPTPHSAAAPSQTSEPIAVRDPCPLSATAPSPHPEPTRHVELPAVPKLEPRELTYADNGALTVWGAGFQLRRDLHRSSATAKDVVIRGIVAKTTLPDVPKCAVHATGIADPVDCRAEIPAFWLCDRQDDPLEKCIKVMGWASNNAQIFDALKEFDKDEYAAVVDNFWGVTLPNPLPTVGAELQVNGTHSTSFTMASSGAEQNEFMGILTSREIATLMEGPELATLPGVKRKPKW